MAIKQVQSTPQTVQQGKNPHVPEGMTSQAPTGPDRYDFHNTFWSKQTDARYQERKKLEEEGKIENPIGNAFGAQPDKKE